jgi:hypothetical protein
MVNEALTTRLARERLDAIRRFVPIRDSVRNKLQQRQSLQTDFALGSEELFKPVTTATKGVERALLGDDPETGKSVIGELEKLAAKTEQTDPKKTTVSLLNKFTDHAKIVIKQFNLFKSKDYRAFGDFAAQSYNSKKDFLKDEYKNDRISSNDWSDNLYKLNKGIGRLNKDEMGYKEFQRGISNYKREQIEERQRELEERRQTPTRRQTRRQKKQQLPPDDDDDDLEERRQTPTRRQKKQEEPNDDYLQETDLEKIDEAAGYSGSGLQNPRIGNTCPDSVIHDISRLDVLVGGFRAGNNSPEIINEAADICRRLFAGGIMDIKTYRDFIDELANGYHSD